MPKAIVLIDRFDRALAYATHVHGGQVHKGTSIPCVAHLPAVAATVLEYGSDEGLTTPGFCMTTSAPRRPADQQIILPDREMTLGGVPGSSMMDGHQ